MIKPNLAPGKDHYNRWSVNIKSHWTPAYLWSRYKEYVFRKKHPSYPWLTQDAINIIGSILLRTDAVLEFGSGRSTVWFAQRSRKVTSVESHIEWFQVVKEMLKDMHHKVEYILVPDPEKQEEGYRDVIRKVPDASIDLCLIDGGPRALCAVESVSKVKSGGFLVVDNVNWFLPSESKSPNSVRSLDQCDPLFRNFYDLVKTWRIIWTSNGVTDTAIYIKP